MSRFEQVCFFFHFCCLPDWVRGLISDGPKSIFSLALDVSGRSDGLLLLLPPHVNNSSATGKSDLPLYSKFKFFACFKGKTRLSVVVEGLCSVVCSLHTSINSGFQIRSLSPVCLGTPALGSWPQCSGPHLCMKTLKWHCAVGRSAL